jgi:Predicted esterase of the alpha-beta hydrolase superfamily
MNTIARLLLLVVALVFSSASLPIVVYAWTWNSHHNHYKHYRKNVSSLRKHHHHHRGRLHSFGVLRGRLGEIAVVAPRRERNISCNYCHNDIAHIKNRQSSRKQGITAIYSSNNVDVDDNNVGIVSHDHGGAKEQKDQSKSQSQQYNKEPIVPLLQDNPKNSLSGLSPQHKHDEQEEQEISTAGEIKKEPLLEKGQKRHNGNKKATDVFKRKWRAVKILKRIKEIQSLREKNFRNSSIQNVTFANGVVKNITAVGANGEIYLYPFKEKRHIKNGGYIEGKKKVETTLVTNVQELREAVLDRGIELKNIEFQNVSFVPRSSSSNNNTTFTQKNKKWTPPIISTSKKVKPKFDPTASPNIHVNSTISQVMSSSWDNHPVLELIEMRSKTKSKPGLRAVNDTATLALAIEGGGMRGAVSAGMASAVAVLGLSDVFDCIYGSSAGSVVGAYMVSRQMCIDVYTDVLTTAKSKFVSKGRLASSLATNLIDTRVLNKTSTFSKYVSPAMNISFVLDGIMCPRGGLRPLDLEKFRINDQQQPLRVVTSTVRQGKMETHCLGSRNMDFFDKVDNETGAVLERATTMLNSKDRHGFFACLETSMLVPAATGPPLPLLRNKDAHLNVTTRCFDAFCYEPIPYRSAVEEGATHVLVLKTRPDGSPIGTKPGLFEKVFAPMYFDSNGMPQVSKYFENGGQQYIYVEDYLTLDQGRDHVVDEREPETIDGIPVPPPKILYGIQRDKEAEHLATNRDKWKRAHLFPLALAEGKPELSTLSVDQEEVLQGVKMGFAAAFDLLAPLANVELNSHLNGDRVADLLFSHVGTSVNVLEVPVPIAGDLILESGESCRVTNCQTCTKTMEQKVARDLRSAYFMHELEVERESQQPCPIRDASELLDSLPGFHRGRMVSLSKGLHRLKENRTLSRGEVR